MINKKLMVYGFHKDEEQNLLLISYKAKAKLIKVEDDMTSLFLEDILEGKRQQGEILACNANNEKFVVFHGFSQRELNETISLIRKHRELGCILAVTTDTTMKWRFCELINHLVEERAQIRGNN